MRALLFACSLLGVAHAQPQPQSCAPEDRPVPAAGLQIGRLKLTDEAGFRNAWTRAGVAATLSNDACYPSPTTAEPRAFVSVGLTDTGEKLDVVASGKVRDHLHVQTLAGRFSASGVVTARIVDIEGVRVGEAVAPVTAVDGRAMFVMVLVEKPRQRQDSVWPIGRSLLGQGDAQAQDELVARFRRLYAGMEIR